MNSSSRKRPNDGEDNGSDAKKEKPEEPEPVMDSSARKRRNDGDDNGSDAKKEKPEEDKETPLTKFTKFPGLVATLREHVLSYNDNPTLFEFSQCSAQSNKDIKRMNVTAPSELKIVYDDNQTLVNLKYNYNWAKKHFDNNLPDKVQKIAEYLTDQFRHVQNGQVKKISINQQAHWPNQALQTIPRLTEVEQLNITMYPPIYDNVMEYIGNLEHLKNLVLKQDEQDVPIREDFFKTNVFRGLEKFKCEHPCEIDYEDFKNTSPSMNIVMKAPITVEALRAKMRQFGALANDEKAKLELDLPDAVNLDSLLEGFEADRHTFGQIEMFEIERLIGTVSEQGRRLRLEVGPNVLRHDRDSSTSSSSDDSSESDSSESDEDEEEEDEEEEEEEEENN